MGKRRFVNSAYIEFDKERAWEREGLLTVPILSLIKRELGKEKVC